MEIINNDDDDKAIELAKNELFEIQKERSSLMRWKLILISVIGSASLGFSEKSSLPNVNLALCLIPFTCVYVDILCRNLSIRAKMISLFLGKSMKDPLEKFYQKYKNLRGISLESLALGYSTIFLSSLVIAVGIISYCGDSLSMKTWFNWESMLFCFSGFSGFIIFCFVENRYKVQKGALDKVQEDAPE